MIVRAFPCSHDVRHAMVSEDPDNGKTFIDETDIKDLSGSWIKRQINLKTAIESFSLSKEEIVENGHRDRLIMYTVRPDGKIDVVNSCRDEHDGSLREAKGRAWVVDKNSNAQLKVSFFWPFRGDYWIIDLGRDYEYAVVGTPNRRYLWILSRTPEMDPDILEKIIQNVEKQGFVRSNLLLHNQDNLL